MIGVCTSSAVIAQKSPPPMMGNRQRHRFTTLEFVGDCPVLLPFDFVFERGQEQVSGVQSQVDTRQEEVPFG